MCDGVGVKVWRCGDVEVYEGVEAYEEVDEEASGLEAASGRKGRWRKE